MFVSLKWRAVTRLSDQCVLLAISCQPNTKPAEPVVQASLSHLHGLAGFQPLIWLKHEKFGLPVPRASWDELSCTDSI